MTRGPAVTGGGGRGPAYARLAADLEARIRAGEWAPGARFPSLRELWQGGGETTVKAAVRVLRERGLVVAVPGSGTFVADPLPDPGTPVTPADLPARVAALEERVARLEEGGRSG